MKTECIRCKNNFENPDHPMAHFSTICANCRKESEETISDQNNYQMKMHQWLRYWDKEGYNKFCGIS